jgi:hypothetical protein
MASMFAFPIRRQHPYSYMPPQPLLFLPTAGPDPDLILSDLPGSSQASSRLAESPEGYAMPCHAIPCNVVDVSSFRGHLALRADHTLNGPRQPHHVPVLTFPRHTTCGGCPLLLVLSSPVGDVPPIFLADREMRQGHPRSQTHDCPHSACISRKYTLRISRGHYPLRHRPGLSRSPPRGHDGPRYLPWGFEQKKHTSDVW